MVISNFLPTGNAPAGSTECVTELASEAGDLELVRLARAGDADAFGALVDRHRQAVFRAAYAALGSHPEADDAAQEAFVTAYRRLSTFREQSSFRTWLLAIAWRKALDRRQGIRRWLRLSARPGIIGGEMPEAVDRLCSEGPSHEDRLTGRQLQRHLARLISSLKPQLRDALLLAAGGEHSYDEIAAMLGIPAGTLKWRVSEARRILRAKLAATGYSHE